MSGMLRAVLPARLIRLRTERGWTQAQFALESNIGLTTVGNIERGGVGSNPDLNTVDKIRRLFGVGFDYLLIDPDEELAYCEHRIVFSVLKGLCSGCDLPAALVNPHSVPECVIALHASGRTRSLIAARFGLTLKSVETILEEEYNIAIPKRIGVGSGSS